MLCAWNMMNGKGLVKKESYRQLLDSKKYGLLKREYSISITEGNSHLSKKVYQVNIISGEITKKWLSISAASNATGIDRSGISMCATGEIQTFKNSIWIYPENYNEDRKNNIINQDYIQKGKNHHHAKAIYKVDIYTAKILEKWDCIVDAATSLGVTQTGISQCVAKTSKTQNGVTWVAIEDYTPERKKEIILLNRKWLGSKLVGKINLKTGDILLYKGAALAAHENNLTQTNVSNRCRLGKEIYGNKWIYIRKIQGPVWFKKEENASGIRI